MKGDAQNSWPLAPSHTLFTYTWAKIKQFDDAWSWQVCRETDGPLYGWCVSWYPMEDHFAIALKITNVEKPFQRAKPLTAWGNLVHV